MATVRRVRPKGCSPKRQAGITGFTVRRSGRKTNGWSGMEAGWELGQVCLQASACDAMTDCEGCVHVIELDLLTRPPINWSDSLGG
jgi:hypothetical protein